MGFEILELSHRGDTGHGCTSWALDCACFSNRAASTQMVSENRTLIDVAWNNQQKFADQNLGN